MSDMDIRTERIDAQRKFALPMIEKKILEVKNRPTVLYMNLVALFTSSVLAKPLVPNETELSSLKKYVANKLTDEGHKVRMNETPVIEVAVS